MVPSITANCPSPEAVKPLRPIILPPLCLTAWCLFLEWLYADEGIQLIDFRCVEAAMHLKVVGEQLLRSGLGHSLSTNGFFFQACIYLYLSKGHQSGKKRKIRKLKIKLIYSSDNFWLTNRIFKKKWSGPDKDAPVNTLLVCWSLRCIKFQPATGWTGWN